MSDGDASLHEKYASYCQSLSPTNCAARQLVVLLGTTGNGETGEGILLEYEIDPDSETPLADAFGVYEENARKLLEKLEGAPSRSET